MTLKIWLTCSLVGFVYWLILGAFYLRISKDGKLWEYFLGLVVVPLIGPFGVLFCFLSTVGVLGTTLRNTDWIDKTILGTNPFYKLSQKEQEDKYDNI